MAYVDQRDAGKRGCNDDVHHGLVDRHVDPEDLDADPRHKFKLVLRVVTLVDVQSEGARWRGEDCAERRGDGEETSLDHAVEPVFG
ncbi:unannotated protein [freshwater metagenome]|uniref:Unannotated protein n=1 Tax=freshwater metagenome TaxID=449393 RepID=A0A6J7RLS3_9ZZZZ